MSFLKTAKASPLTTKKPSSSTPWCLTPPGECITPTGSTCPTTSTSARTNLALAEDRVFDQGAAAFLGGVVFAQTTQSTHEVQQFPPGVAIPIPRHSKIIGQVHQLNATGAALDSTYSIRLVTIPESEVRVKLSGMLLEYHPLNIPPMSQAAFTTSCDYGSVHEQLLARPVDFNLYYALPHYHSLGTGMSLTVRGGVADGQTVFQTRAGIGEPAGQTYLTPLSFRRQQPGAHVHV